VGRAYGVPVAGGGPDTTEGLRSRVARGRPNWWVILAVSLALMALLVATAGNGPRAKRHDGTLASAPTSHPRRPAGSADAGAPSNAHALRTTTTTTTSTTTSTTLPSGGRPFGASGTSLLSTRTLGATVTAPPAAVPVVTTTVPPTTTTTSVGASVPAARTQTQGYIDPPLQTSNSYGFTGTGAMEISAVWSGSTYLTMEVSCPNARETVGGTSAMAASLPDAGGSCLATVSEPSSETTALTYTITIGPANG
jgi:hypothetical protein